LNEKFLKAIDIVATYTTTESPLTPYNLYNAKENIVKKLETVQIELPDELINQIVQSPRQVMEAINLLGIDRDSIL